MRIKYFLATTIVVAIFLSSCSRNYVALDYTNARGEVPRLGNLVFRFNKSLYPDSMLNNWDSTDYISFEPRIPGRFRWTGPDELVFSPAEPLLPATTYKAKSRDEVFHYSKFNDVRDADDIKFNTAPLQLNDAQVTWVLQDESRRLAVPQINLQFNYPVQAEEVKKKLQVEIDGVKTDYTMQNIGASETVFIRLNGFKGEDKSYEAVVNIDKGLQPEKGEERTTD